VLKHHEFDWLLNERGCFEPKDFIGAFEPYFNAASFDLPCILSACEDDRFRELTEKFKYFKYIDEVLGRMSMVETTDKYRKPHPELVEYWRSNGKRPEQFRRAADYYWENVGKAKWLAKHVGEYVAILGTEPVKLVSDRNLATLVSRAEKEWGEEQLGYGRPIFRRYVSGTEHRQRELLLPLEREDFST